MKEGHWLPYLYEYINCIENIQVLLVHIISLTQKSYFKCLLQKMDVFGNHTLDTSLLLTFEYVIETVH